MFLFFKICRRLDNLNSFNIIQTSTLAKEMFVPSITVWNFTKMLHISVLLKIPLLFFHFQIIGKYTRYIHKYNSTADIYFHENFPWNHIHKNFPWNHFDKNWEIDFTKKITSKSTLPRPFCQKNCVNRRVEMFWLSITTRGEHTQNFWKSKACF